MKYTLLSLALTLFVSCSKEDAAKTQVSTQNAPVQVAQSAPAPSGVPLNNSHCPVTGAKIGSMGQPVLVEHQGKVISLCCRGCAADFAKDPEKYMKILAEQTKASDDPHAGHDHSEHDHSGHNH